MNGAFEPGAQSEQDLLAAMLEEYGPSSSCRRGDIVKGVIVRVTPKFILIDIGSKCDAVVHPREVEQMSPKDLRGLRPGQDVSAYVLDAGEQENLIIVSLAKANQEQDWVRAQELLDSGEAVELEVVDFNKGGVIVHLGRLRGFVPGSQLSSSWRSSQSGEDTDDRWETLVGKKLTLKVIEVTSHRNRLIFSERKAVPVRSRKRDVLEDLKPGTVEKGVVSNVVDFGAFVNVRGIDGLLHISEISWQRVRHPSEVLTPGAEIEVYVLGVDLEKGRLSLSLKRLEPDPWTVLEQEYHEGQLVEVKIVNLTSFGAFARLVDIPEVEGLIHISELCDHPVVRPEEVIKMGECRVARILSMRPDARRVAFSLKQVNAGESPETENWQETQKTLHDQEQGHAAG
ncbi:MAG: S1 RNA-binding domain-containing protein [Anaerolineae bacterium]|nr:S1 RNA-binding domain-containing protein [Anaerolineae bacterium]